MKLIVEAGSTKTDSILIRNGQVHGGQKSSPGINPVTDPHYRQKVHDLIGLYPADQISSVIYYGSGCINEEVNEKVRKLILSFLPAETAVEVQMDLLAAARGLCQHEEGIIIILGTGSNIGYYDGEKLVDGIKSCGYLLGDEGSGYRIGQAIFRRFAREELGVNQALLISEQFGISPDTAIPELYRQDNPRQYLASFSTAISLLESGVKNEIVDEVFTTLTRRLIVPIHSKYPSPVHFCGSIAFYFTEELKQKLAEFNILASSFERSPLEGLVKYHSDG